jgi:hypothetical protein
MANVKFEYNGKLSDGRFFDDDSKKKVVVELEDSDLTVDEMLEEFMNFMQAIGYKFEVGDRFEVKNDFKDSDTKDSDTMVSQEKVLTPTDEEIAEEVSRLRSMTMGLSEEALLISAHINLGNKKN